MRALNNLARAADVIGIRNAEQLMAQAEKAKGFYTKEKNAKVADVVDRNLPQENVYTGKDYAEMKKHATRLFTEQVGRPVVRISFLAKEWKRLNERIYRNGAWSKRIYSVIRATTYAKIEDGYVGEFQGFLYMDENNKLTSYEVASYDKGKSVPPSNKIRAKQFSELN